MSTGSHSQEIRAGCPADPSIRDTLESDAWRRYPEFAHRRARLRGLPAGPDAGLRWHDRVLLILAIVLFAMILLRTETARADDFWGIELVSSTSQWNSMALETRMSVDVTGLVARVEVQQVFINQGTDWAEGVYRFPLPDGAAVDRMQIEVGNRIIAGEIRERQEARRVYQQARAAGQVASLLEQQRPHQYESRLANIGPGETIRVTIGFLCNVQWRDGSFSLRLPMTFAPRWDNHRASARIDPAPAPQLTVPESGHHRPLRLEFLLRTSLGYNSIESRYHDVDISLVPEGYRVALLDERDLPDRDFELTWTPELGAEPRAELLTWDGGDAVYAQLMLAPPLLEGLEPQAREVVFIIDTSGSMEGAPLNQARAALKNGLEQLEPSDAFNLIQFNSETEQLFDQSVPATDHHRALAREYLEGLQADGGTVMAPALEAALSLPALHGQFRQVVFITDGSVGNEPELLLQIAEQLEGSRLFTVGIGSAPNSWFMRKAAETGRGTHTHIGRLEDVEERMVSLWTRIRNPAVSDVCIDLGVDAEYYPEVIPDLYAGEPLWITARMSLLPREVFLCGQLNGQPWGLNARPRLSEGAEALATLWARKKIEALEDSIVYGADPDAIKSEVTDIALRHELLTRHTSLVAVDRTPARASDVTLGRASIPSLLPAGSTAASAGFPATATGWVAQVLLSALTLLMATGLYLFCGRRLPLSPSPAVDGTSLK